MAVSQVLSVAPLTVKSSDQIKTDALNTVYNGLINIGYSNPNVGPNTYWDLVFTGLAQEAGIIGLNTQIIGDQSMPDTALATDLDRWLNFFNLPRKLATNATGGIVVQSSNSTFVPTGTQLQVNGIRYQVLYGGTFGNGSTITVQSINPGLSANQEAGTVLQWVQTPIYFNPIATVSETFPISGGINSEDDETARSRLSSFFATPIAAADPSQIIAWAQESDPSVQFANVYPCARGPATLDVSVYTYATLEGQQRPVDSTLLANNISSYIKNRISLGIDVLVTNVVDYPIDISINLSLPNAVNSSQPGTGLGFLDPNPWKVTAAKPVVRVVDGYAISGSDPTVPQNSATSFWVDFPVPPVNGTVYNISFFSPVTLITTSAQTGSTFIPATNFASLSSHTSLYYISINAPFYDDANINSPIKPGTHLFPTAQNTQIYVTALLNYMFSMGPGERTANTGLTANGRARRFPFDKDQYPYTIDNRLLHSVITSSSEILTGTFNYYGIYTNTPYTFVPNGSAITDSTAYTKYTTISYNGDPAYALSTPPTAYNFNGNGTGSSLIFTPNNISFYSMT